MKEMTKWFPPHIKPVHKGVYEVRMVNNKGNKYCYYDKRGWRLCCVRLDTALEIAEQLKASNEKEFYTSEFMHSSMMLVCLKWRGFTKEQT
jgi:putative component of toxin-antitoxin plasmid stabilization module